MIALREPVAGCADAAGVAIVLDVLAQQRLGERFHEVRLADAGRAMEQDRVRQAYAHLLQPGPGLGLPRIGAQNSLSSAAPMAVRTSSMDAVESITAIRRGFSCARRRYSARHLPK